MEMEAFIRKTCKAVGERLGSGFHVEARDVRKNNGVILHGMSVMKKVADTLARMEFLKSSRIMEGNSTIFATIMLTRNTDRPPQMRCATSV